MYVNGEPSHNYVYYLNPKIPNSEFLLQIQVTLYCSLVEKLVDGLSVRVCFNARMCTVIRFVHEYICHSLHTCVYRNLGLHRTIYGAAAGGWGYLREYNTVFSCVLPHSYR